MKLKFVIVEDRKHGRENLTRILREYCPKGGVIGRSGYFGNESHENYRLINESGRLISFTF